MKDYQFFEKLRDNKGGGGLLIAVDKTLNPALIDSENDVELLVVELTVANKKVCVINGYGPQEYDDILL